MPDLSGLPVADVHCHGFRKDDVIAAGAEGWADRITLVGMCMLSSASADPALRAQVTDLTDSSIFAMTSRRWLADFLGVVEGELETERMRRFQADADAYLRSILSDQNITDLFVDDGYPQPPVDGAELAQLTGAQVHRVARIEPIIDSIRNEATTAAELEDRFRAELEECGSDPTCVGYKSVIAYRTGLRVTDPSKEEVEGAFQAWRKGDWDDTEQVSKPVRDRLLHVTAEVAGTQDRAVHIHSGAGDPDCVLDEVHPTGLVPLIAAQPNTPIVLIHSGWPWVNEAAYIAGLYPNAHIDMSFLHPWSTLDIDRALTTVLGLVPTGKVMYGSDEASEPEVLWVSARMFRPALERVLQRAIKGDLITAAQAEPIGAGVLAANALRLHGLAPR